jgi:DNA polymerase V
MGKYQGDDTTGFQSPAQDYVEVVPDLVKVLRLDRPGLYPMRVEGDGLAARGIFHGDIVIVNAAADPASNQVCVAVLRGETVIATLHQREEGWAIRRGSGELVSVDEDENVDVWGMVNTLIRTKV